MSVIDHEMRFKKLPPRLMQRWWEWTYYGKHPATNELMWTIEALDRELAEYLALGDAERTKETWGGKRTSGQITKENLSTQAKTLFAAMCASGGRGEEE